MRSAVLAVGAALLVAAFACGNTIDDQSGARNAGGPTDAGVDAEAASPLPTSDATTGGGSGGPGGPTPVHAACVVSRECASGKCFPDPDGATNDAGIPVGQCVEDDSCVTATAKKVDPQCLDVIACLGFHCVQTGIVAGPTGVFACGIPGDACTTEEGTKCCYTDCGDDGKCLEPDN